MNNSLIQISFALIISITGMILLSRYLNLHAFFSLIAASLTYVLMIGKNSLMGVRKLARRITTLITSIILFQFV